MAKYIKFNLSAPAGATGSSLLINIDQITSIATASTTTTDIFYDNIVTATKKWTITHTVPLVVNSILDAINSAMTSNPGGVVSTVGSPVNTAQVPVAQTAGSQGRIAITTAQVNVDYASAAATA